MKIIIIRLSALGDILHTLWVMKQFREDFSTAQISILTNENNRTLLENLEYFNEVLTLRKASWYKDLRALAATRQFDYAIDFQSRLKSAICAKFLARKVYGYASCGAKNKLASLLYDKKFQIDYFANVYVRSRGLYLFFARDVLGKEPGDSLIKIGNFLEYKDTPKSPKPVDEKDEKFILIHNGASKLKKALKIELLEDFILQLEQRFGDEFSLFFSWGSEVEFARAKRLEKICPKNRAKVLEKMSLKELAKLSAKASLIIAHDSGPLYLGVLSGASTLGIVRTHGKKQIERIQCESEKNLMIKMDDFCPKEAIKCCEKLLEKGNG